MRDKLDQLAHEVAMTGIRLIDDAHVSWRCAQAATALALAAWRDAAPSHRAALSLGYRAALDREEAAARDLERLWRIAHEVSFDRAPASSGSRLANRAVTWTEERLARLRTLRVA